MSLDVDNLAELMSRLLKDITINKEIRSLGNLKQHLIYKKQILDSFIGEIQDKITSNSNCKLTKNLISDLKQISGELYSLYEDFDDKLMIFIIGNGNVGKSTLLNSLIGYEVAKVDFCPVTWKIDVYSPEIKKNEAVIKYIDGKKKIISLEKAKEIISTEEKQAKKAEDIYKEKKNEELKKIKIPAARKEMIKFLEEKYLYESKVSEVRWPVTKNSLLEKCLLVDTPGLNQNSYIKNNFANVNYYYHKADGVLFLLDANSIDGSSSKNQIEELDKDFNGIGKSKKNIVCIINKIDLAINNDPENSNNAEKQIINNVKKIFQNKFSEIVPLSAKQAIEGEKNNDFEAIKNSGILKLKEAIEKIFLSKSEEVKKKAKNDGYERLLSILDSNLNNYFYQISNYEEMYIKKNKDLDILNKNFKNTLEEDVNEFFNNYLLGVSNRVDAHINALANGEKEDFVKNVMYQLDDFIQSKDNFLNSKYSEIKNNYFSWSKLCRINQYKYIENQNLVVNKNFINQIDLNLDSLNTIDYFTPSKKDDVFSILGNLFGKGMFLFRKTKIKDTINNTIKAECDEMKADILNNLNNILNAVYNECKNILNNSFSDILFDFNHINSVKREINNFNIIIKQEMNPINLKDIIF